MAAKEIVVGHAQGPLLSGTLHVVDLLKSSTPLSGQDDEGLEEAISCRPASMSDYRRRLATFRVCNWFNKPLAVSPIQCARRGLVNDGYDVVRCEVCDVRTEWTGASESSAANWIEECHSKFCPWRCSEVVRADPAALSDADVLDGFQSRLHCLQAMVAVPKLPEIRLKEFPDNPLKVLAALGWEYAGDIGGHGRLEEHVQRIACTSCMRTVPVQCFSHQRLGKISSSSMSPAGAAGQAVTSRSVSTPMDAVQRKRAAEAADLMRKRRKSGAKAEKESSENVAARIARSLSSLRNPRETDPKTSGVSSTQANDSKASRESASTDFETPKRSLTKSTSDLSEGKSGETVSVLGQVLPPLSGLWVPSQRLQDSPNSDVDFDPSYMHKWYCPWFSAPGEALSPFGRRAVELAKQGSK
eukprot:gnl/MRDRNA2_/MRDRNA2_34506_c0_seq1.p1 gnl/MRDRNA2_/MRDRNA2_34506_c0~~gnl/MRDRNA2_/MRDRNA2_34506_c0_seq1.p1  ORF type:complete len:414 (-),score=69.17 gnl/MRDRNA2_/MRDRNA2_34506_c0_seq1:119-1360(-)